MPPDNKQMSISRRIDVPMMNHLDFFSTCDVFFHAFFMHTVLVYEYDHRFLCVFGQSIDQTMGKKVLFSSSWGADKKVFIDWIGEKVCKLAFQSRFRGARAASGNQSASEWLSFENWAAPGFPFWQPETRASTLYLPQFCVFRAKVIQAKWNSRREWEAERISKTSFCSICVIETQRDVAVVLSIEIQSSFPVLISAPFSTRGPEGNSQFSYCLCSCD